MLFMRASIQLLYHAIVMVWMLGIVNAGMMEVYENIPKGLLQAVEGVLLNKDDGATRRIIRII